MEKAVRHFADQLAGIHGGVVSPSLIDTVKVEYHGQPTPVAHLAHTLPQDGRIAITPFDPALLGAIAAALKGRGFDAYVASKTSVVVPLPRFAGQADREKVAAQVRRLEEEAKVAVRMIRKKARPKRSLPEDALRAVEKELQEMTDRAVARIAALADGKVRSL